MEQKQITKYEIAWQKLAECMHKKEKERSLGVYRLLSKAIEDTALIYQLEGDILLAFDDQVAALAVYEKSALSFLAQKKYIHAVAVCDHMFTLSGDYSNVDRLIEICEKLNNPEPVEKYLYHVCLLMLRRNDYDQMLHLLDRFERMGFDRAVFLKETVYKVCADHLIPSDIKTKLLRTTLDFIMHDAQKVGEFLSTLKTVDIYCYHEACAYMQS